MIYAWVCVDLFKLAYDLSIIHEVNKTLDV
jgi:hypothetical protein